jgi:hypothetical protein
MKEDYAMFILDGAELGSKGFGRLRTKDQETAFRQDCVRSLASGGEFGSQQMDPRLRDEAELAATSPMLGVLGVIERCRASGLEATEAQAFDALCIFAPVIRHSEAEAE